jgi:phosphatidylserine decarboxylase
MTLASYFILVGLLTLSITAMGRKWQLKPKHYLPWAAAMAVLGCVALTAIFSVSPATPWWLTTALALGVGYAASIGAILYFFFRDPERESPQDDSQIVSPADGTIVYIKKIENGRFPFAVKNNNTIPLSEFVAADFVPQEGVQIGIAMNFLNVHVNRSPISGVVKLVRRIPGEFKSLKHIASLLENERVLMVVKGQHLEIGMVQIASRLVRRIVPFVAEGQLIPQGCRVGVIRFGSQVDLLIPATPGVDVTVQVGDEVTAGETVIATHKFASQSGVNSSDSAASTAAVASLTPCVST